MEKAISLQAGMYKTGRARRCSPHLGHLGKSLIRGGWTNRWLERFTQNEGGENDLSIFD
ncbi:MAG: hypothetical protein RH917_02990 [Lacipirellulaceae bacterium]